MASKGRKRVLPPHVALDSEKQKIFNQNTQKAKLKVAAGPSEAGVVYISHLPWGFTEKPMRSFFKQFGSIDKLRISKSKKTGNSKGYAYIQFSHAEVAKIVADTMNNYLMFDKLMKCKFLPAPHPDTFKNADRPFVVAKGPSKAVRQRNMAKSEAAQLKSKQKALQKLSKKKKKLAELGIEYSIEVEGTIGSVKVKEETDEEGKDSSTTETDKVPTQLKQNKVGNTKQKGKGSKADTEEDKQKPVRDTGARKSVKSAVKKDEATGAKSQESPKRKLSDSLSQQNVKKGKQSPVSVSTPRSLRAANRLKTTASASKLKAKK